MDNESRLLAVKALVARTAALQNELLHYRNGSSVSEDATDFGLQEISGWKRLCSRVEKEKHLLCSLLGELELQPFDKHESQAANSYNSYVPCLPSRTEMLYNKAMCSNVPVLEGVWRTVVELHTGSNASATAVYRKFRFEAGCLSFPKLFHPCSCVACFYQS